MSDVGRGDTAVSLEGEIDAVDRETHDIEVTADHILYTDIADILLYAVGTRFIQGAVLIDIVVDLCVGERAESYIGAIDKRLLLRSGGEGNARIDLVGVSAEAVEHAFGIVEVVRFAEHLPMEPHDGVGGDEQVIGLEMWGIRLRFLAGYIERYVARLQVSGELLVGMDINSLEGYIEPRKQTASARRLRAKNKVHSRLESTHDDKTKKHTDEHDELHQQLCAAVVGGDFCRPKQPYLAR